MRLVIVGQNAQGLLQQHVVGSACVALVSNIQTIDINSYDAVYICAANDIKYTIARFAIVNKKHVWIEPVLWANSIAQLDDLEQLAQKNKVALYVGYNHRFISEFVHARNLLDQNALGISNYCRIAYTANQQEKKDGALFDLMPHLLDLLCFWFGTEIMQNNFSIVHKAADGMLVILADYQAALKLELAANFYGQENSISVDIYAAKKNLHLNHILDDTTLTRAREFVYFQELCHKSRALENFTIDKWIYAELDRLGSEQIFLA